MTCLRPLLLIFAIGILLPAALLFPTAARADNHDDWELHVNSYPGPLGGACGAPLEARGWLFPPDTEVAVGLISGVGLFTELARIVTTQNGFLRFDLPDPYPPDCEPGAILTFAARVATPESFLSGPSGPYQAISIIETRPIPPAHLVVSAAQPGSCISITVSGVGFPPERQIMLMFGDAHPFAHDFAEFARATTDESGDFDVTTDYFRLSPCLDGDQIGIYAFLWNPPKGFDPTFPKITAIYTVGAPNPASTGNAALSHDATPSRRLQLLLLAATIMLVTVGRATSPGASQ